MLENADPVGALAEGGLTGSLGEQSVLSAGVHLAALLLCLCSCRFRGGDGCVFGQQGGEGNRDQGKEKQLHGFQFGVSSLNSIEVFFGLMVAPQVFSN